MKIKSLAFIIILSIVLIACGSTEVASSNQTTANNNAVEDTEPTPLPPTATSIPPTPEPTNTAIPTPTETPLPVSGDTVYTANFSNFFDEWFLFGQQDIELYDITAGETLNIILPDAYDTLYAYQEIDYQSPNVQIDATVELVDGTNFTLFHLLCRSNDIGEYVFMLDTGGYWQVQYYDAVVSELTELGYGGSLAINTGKAVNEVTVICNETQISFWINGTEVFSGTDDRNLAAGEISFSVGVADIPYVEFVIHDLAVSVP